MQAAVLHSLGVIEALVQLHMLTRDTCLSELLARGAEWAGTLTGDLAHAGSNTCQMLQYKHAEMVKHQMEQELSEATYIKMKIENKDVDIKCSKYLQ